MHIEESFDTSLIWVMGRENRPWPKGLNSKVDHIHIIMFGLMLFIKGRRNKSYFLNGSATKATKK